MADSTGNFKAATAGTTYATVVATPGPQDIQHHWAVETHAEGAAAGRTYYPNAAYSSPPVA